MRRYTTIDGLISGFDDFLSQAVAAKRPASRPNPAETAIDGPLTPAMKSISIGLMRVDHAGEVCAQALYQGQGLTARNPQVKKIMLTAAKEEVDHLVWCSQRLGELESHTSYLNPFWYVGSLSFGIVAGLLGDRWSLGFIVETEHQVVRHLDSHMGELPDNDRRSRAILEQMRSDESQHATIADESGAAELPLPVRRMMRLCSRIMTGTAYWI